MPSKSIMQIAQLIFDVHKSGSIVEAEKGWDPFAEHDCIYWMSGKEDDFEEVTIIPNPLEITKTHYRDYLCSIPEGAATTHYKLNTDVITINSGGYVGNGFDIYSCALEYEASEDGESFLSENKSKIIEVCLPKIKQAMKKNEESRFPQEHFPVYVPTIWEWQCHTCEDFYNGGFESEVYVNFLGILDMSKLQSEECNEK